MEITFNLKDAQAYLPSGKIMNLKSQLKWDELEITEKDISEAVESTVYEKFNIKMDFDNTMSSLGNNFLNHTRSSRNSVITELSKKYILDENLFKSSEEKLIEEQKSLMSEIGQSMMLNAKVIEKIQKLDRLKLINS